MKTNENVLKKLDIMRALAYVPGDRLKEVETFIEFILRESHINLKKHGKEPGTLRGIWKKKGFEKIAYLDEEIGNLRRELGNQILLRHTR